MGVTHVLAAPALLRWAGWIELANPVMLATLIAGSTILVVRARKYVR